MNFRFAPTGRAVCFCLLVLSILPSTAVVAQEATRINVRQNTANSTGPVLFRGEMPLRISNADMGDIQLVNRQARPEMLTFSTTQLVSYTNNAFLTPSNQTHSFLYNGAASVSFVPYARANLTPRLTFEQNFYRYDRVSSLDFDSQSLQLDVKYDLVRDDSWFANFNIDASRLYSPRQNAGEFYRSGLVSAGLTNQRALRDWPLFLASNLVIGWRLGDDSAYDRWTLTWNESLIYQPIAQLQVALYTRAELGIYINDPLESDRRDLNLNIGASVTWTLCDHANIGLNANFVGNYSSDSRNKYEVVSPGLFLAAGIAF